MLTTNHITMNKFISFITMLILPAALLSACDNSGLNTGCPAGFSGPSCSVRVGDGAGAGNGSQETGVKDAGTTEEVGTEKNLPPFDLPEGWVWVNTQEWEADKEPLLNRDIDAPFTGIAYSGKKAGGQSEAQLLLQAVHQKNLGEYEDALLPPVYKELEESGIKVYAAMSTYMLGIPNWYSEFAFEKNGGVAYFHFGGRIDDNLDILKKIVKTYRD